MQSECVLMCIRWCKSYGCVSEAAWTDLGWNPSAATQQHLELGQVRVHSLVQWVSVGSCVPGTVLGSRDAENKGCSGELNTSVGDRQ